MEQKYAANILMSLLKEEEGENTITLDQDDAQNLYRICVTSVQNIDENVNRPLYKDLLAGYLLKQKEIAGEEQDDDDEEEKDDEEDSQDGSNNEDKDNDSDPDADEGQSNKSPEDNSDDEDDDNEPPPPEKYVRKEPRIKRRHDKPKDDAGKKRGGRVARRSLTLQDTLSAHEEHQEFLKIGAKVKMMHEMHKWKVTALKQIARRWLLSARLKRYARELKTKINLNAGKNKQKVEVMPPECPGNATSQLVLAPSLSRIKEILPQAESTIATKTWIKKVQEHAVKGPHLKIGLLYFEYLLRIQRDYEDMQKRYNNVRMQEFMKTEVTSENEHYQLELLKEQAVNLMSQWATHHMHARTKCQLPEHSCQIQVLELPPEIRISEADNNNSPMLRKLTTASTQQVQIPLELMLGERPKWACLEDMRREVRDLQRHFDNLRKRFTSTMIEVSKPSDQSIAENVKFLKSLMIKVYEYKKVLDSEMDFVIQYLLCQPDTPVCLYGIMPDADSLPNFFPALFPYMQEPRDVEEYVEICDKIKGWRAVFATNNTLMEQLFDVLQYDADRGTWTKESVQESLSNIKAMYEQRGLHQKKLIGHCNDLLQLNLVASRVAAKPKKMTLTVERDIAEQLFEARVYHNQKLNDGWLATADYCVELSKCRYNEGRSTVYNEASHSEVMLTIYEHDILVKNRVTTLTKAQRKMPAPSAIPASTSKKGKGKKAATSTPPGSTSRKGKEKKL